MRLYECLPMVIMSLFLCPMAFPQDVLTPAVKDELAEQCTKDAGYQSCVSALRAHGAGKDDVAIAVLISRAANANAEEHYKIAQAKLKDFWTLVASWGAREALVAAGTPLPRDCKAALHSTLLEHFKLDSKALSNAADDSVKNNFLALSDLLDVPARAPKDWTTTVQVYRYCFTDPNFFPAVKDAISH